jgi:hypothetical protein
MTRRLPALVLACAAPALAQWSSDPAVNFDIADRTGDQGTPKLRPTSDGGCFISWYDNATGGNHPTLQRLNSHGQEAFAHNGISLASTTNSSTVDYDMTVDSANNAFVTFMDNSHGSSVVTVTKVDSAGNFLWGASGIQMAGSTGAANPHVAVLSDGNTAVGWTVSGTVLIQRLDSTGAVIGAPLSLVESGHLLTLSELHASDNGSLIALWVRTFTTNFMSSKWLYSQKFDGANAPVWPVTPGLVAVGVYAPQPNQNGYGSQGGSIQQSYFPPFLSDGAGGAVYGWYENANTRNAYIQHVNADGTARFQANGRSVSPLTRFNGTNNVTTFPTNNPCVAYDAPSDTISFTWSETNSSQAIYWLFGQQYNGAGAEAWTPGGVQLLAPTTNQNSFCKVVSAAALPGGGAMFFTFDARNAAGSIHVIQGWRVNAAGNQDWSPTPFPVCSVVSSKSRLDAALGTTGQALLAWGDNRGGNVDLYVQNVNPNGTLGIPPCPIDFNADGQVNVGDFLAFLGLYAAGDPRADIDANGSINVADFLAFLSAYSAGC